MTTAFIIGGILLCAATVLVGYLRRNSGRRSWLKKLKADRIRRGKLQTGSDVVWVPGPTRW
jgi:hypothetical protein